MASYLITGCSRGLGLSIIATLAKKPASEVRVVFASARSTSRSLEEVVSSSPGRVIFVQLDITDEECVKEAARQVEKMLEDKGLDILINNAGVLNTTPGGIKTMTDLTPTFVTNVSGTHMVTTAFMPLLRKGQKKEVINVSSSMASLANATHYISQPTPAYKISKTALNMLTTLYAHEFAHEGFICVAVNPGWLQTDMGTEKADLPVDVGSKAVIELVNRVTKDDNGKFLDIDVPWWKGNGPPDDYTGATIPW